MGNFFSSRDKQQQQPVNINDEEQFFDCLTDDESHEHDIQIQPQVISHFYAVSIPPSVEVIGNKFYTNINVIGKIIFFSRKSIRLRGYEKCFCSL